MSELKRINYYYIAIISTVFMTGSMGARVLVPLFSNDLNASPTEIGIIVALYSFFPLIFVVHLGKWVDRVGSKKPLLYSIFIGSLTLFIPLLIKTIIGMYIIQIISGLAQTVFAVAAQNYMGKTENELIRENNIAIFSIGVAFGSFLGPLIAGSLSDWIGYGLSFAILGLIGLLSIFLIILLKEHDLSARKAKKQEKGNAFELLKIQNLRTAFLISALILLGKDIYVTYFPLLALEFGLSNKTIGFIVSVNAAAGIFIRWLMPLLIAKLNRQSIIFLSILLSGIFFLSIPFFQSVTVLVILSFMLGMGLGLGQPMSITSTIISLPKDRVGEGLGLRLSVNRLTQVVTPIIFGTMADFVGFPTVFYVVGLLLVAGSTKTKVKNEQNQKVIEN